MLQGLQLEILKDYTEDKVKEGIVKVMSIPHWKQLYLWTVFDWIVGCKQRRSRKDYDEMKDFIDVEFLALNSIIDDLNSDYNETMGI